MLIDDQHIDAHIDQAFIDPNDNILWFHQPINNLTAIFKDERNQIHIVDTLILTRCPSLDYKRYA